MLMNSKKYFDFLQPGSQVFYKNGCLISHASRFGKSNQNLEVSLTRGYGMGNQILPIIMGPGIKKSKSAGTQKVLRRYIYEKIATSEAYKA